MNWKTKLGTLKVGDEVRIAKCYCTSQTCSWALNKYPPYKLVYIMDNGEYNIQNGDGATSTFPVENIEKV